MRIFYKYYIIIFIIFLITAIFMGGCRACLNVYKSDKSIVYIENNIKKEAENIDTEAAKPLINKEKAGDKIENGFNYKNKQQQNVCDEKIMRNKIERNNNIADEDRINVFKVNKNEIIYKYTALEKLELLSILKLKLNEQDYKTIEDLLYSNEKDIEILKKINKILKEKLDEKDYDKILNLASKVINVELVVGK